MPDVPDTAPTADAAPAESDAAPADRVAAATKDAVAAGNEAAPETSAATDTDAAGAPEDLKNSFREALARKAGKNSHVESHLEGRHIGGGNNDTHKRQFRRKSG